MKEETLGERITKPLQFFTCPICGQPRPQTELTCAKCDKELEKAYLKDMEQDFIEEKQCQGCGKWFKRDDPFCSEECFNVYMDRQFEAHELRRLEEQRESTMKFLRRQNGRSNNRKHR